MKFSTLALLTLLAPAAALDTYVDHQRHLNAMIDAHVTPETSNVRLLGTHERVPSHSACEEAEGVECPCMTLPCERESPADVVLEPAEGLPAWLEGQDWRQFTSRVGMPGARDQGGLSIDWVKVAGSGNKGAMIVVPGQSEACTKYDENMYGIIQEGYSPVYCIDHRGQGQSGRMLPEALKGHVEDGSDFIEDFTDFVKNVIVDINADNALKAAADQEERLFLTCHSMGCAITFGYAMREYKAQRSQYFNAIVAYAPLVQPNTSPFPYDVAVAIGATMNLMGIGEDWAPTLEATFDEAYAESGYLHSTTTSYTRWRRSKDNCVRHRDTMYHAGKPDAHTGQCQSGVTANFARELFTWYDRFYDFIWDFVTDRAKLNVPILLQQAGSDDTVINEPQNLFCETANLNCKLTVYETAEHNIWTEVDSIRGPAMTEAFAFFDEHQNQVLAQAPLPPVQECGWSWWTWNCFWSFWPRLGTFLGFSGVSAAAGIFMLKKSQVNNKKHASMTKANEMGEFNKKPDGPLGMCSDADLLSEMKRRGLQGTKL
jgi:lysophospholipase